MKVKKSIRLTEVRELIRKEIRKIGKAPVTSELRQVVSEHVLKRLIEVKLVPDPTIPSGRKPGREGEEREKLLDILQDNYGISEAVQEFLGWDEDDAEDADSSNWDDVVDAIMEDPELKADILDQA